MCKALKREDLIDDKRFSSPAGRVTNAQIRKQITGEEIGKWKGSEILKRLQEEGVPSAPLLDRMELLDNEQILANESISRINIDGFGEVRQARPAARFSKTPSELSRPAPMLGEHSQEIVSSLGVDEAIIKSLIEKKVIALSLIHI